MRYISELARRSCTGPRHVAVLGSTGSIGKNTYAVLCSNPDKFAVTALACGRNIDLLAIQANALKVPYLAVLSENDVPSLRNMLTYPAVIVHGQKGYSELASLSEVDTVVSAQVGAAGLRSTVQAVMHGKTVCLANKESLVLAGGHVRMAAQKSGAVILPVDSEHYALFQSIGHNIENVRRLILTASGGPFRGMSLQELSDVRPSDALKHPNWSMGAKITIDSATMMNKGLEVIEAIHLYGANPSEIDVLVHPQSIVHSLAEFNDGSVIGQLAVPDMRLPISACLAYPDHLDISQNGVARLDLASIGKLSFEKPDPIAFPCLTLASEAYENSLCPELNGANEVAVQRFLSEDIGFNEIPILIENVLSSSANTASHDDLPALAADTVDKIEERDNEARRLARQWSRKTFSHG